MFSWPHHRPSLLAAAIFFLAVGCRHWSPNRYMTHEPNPDWAVAHLDDAATDLSAGLHMEVHDWKSRFLHIPSSGPYPSLADAVAMPYGREIQPIPPAAHGVPVVEHEPAPFDPMVGFDPQRPLLAEHRPNRWWSWQPFGRSRGPSKSARRELPSVLSRD